MSKIYVTVADDGQPRRVSLAEAAQILRVPVRTLRNWIAANRGVPAVFDRKAGGGE